MIQRCLLPSLIGGLLLLAGCGSKDPITAKRIKDVETGLRRSVYLKGLPSEKLKLDKRMAFYRVPGVSVAVIDKNVLEWAKAYGERDVQTRQPMMTDTLSQGGAFSQMVAGAVVSSLAEEGALSFDEDATTVLRSWKFPSEFDRRDRRLDLRSLLAHGAGLSEQILLGYGPDEQVPTLVQMLDGAEPASNGSLWIPPERQAVSLTRYSEAGYVVLEMLLADRTGRTFETLARERVFGPAGMTDSTFTLTLPDELRTRAATGHLREGRPVAGLWKRYPAAAAKGLWTTPTEFAAFLTDLLASAGERVGKILSPPTARAMLGPWLEDYGPGFLVDGRRDDIQFKLRGKTQGFSCMMVLYPVRGQGVVIMTNSDNGFTLIDEMLAAFASAYDWPHYKPEEKQVLRLDSETYKSYTGRYEVGPDYFLDVTWEDYYLIVQPTGQAATRFYAEGRTLFYSTDPYIRIQFLRDRGPVDGLALWQQDFELRAKKIS